MSASPSQRQITQLLLAWRGGDAAALDQLMPLIYDEMRRLALVALGSERTGHTLQPTELVHEAYVRLVGADVPWRDRAHFLAIAARMMRRILVDHARARRRLRRGGGAVHVELTAVQLPARGASADLVDLDDALNRLAGVSQRQSSAVELHFFGGLTYEQTAEVLGVSEATVDRDLRFARAWLFRELSA